MNGLDSRGNTAYSSAAAALPPRSGIIVVTTAAVVRITRAKAGSLVIMRPSTDGGPAQVSAVYSGGGTAGIEFVYPSPKK